MTERIKKSDLETEMVVVHIFTCSSKHSQDHLCPVVRLKLGAEGPCGVGGPGLKSLLWPYLQHKMLL